MGAKEMFEELGLDPIENQPDNMLWYATHNLKAKKGLFRVRFHLLFKTYDVVEYGVIDNRVSVELHKAIHQQMKELGWLDDD